MADERDFELLDDYLTNRMSKEDRSAFDRKLQSDPDLQHEYALQQRLIQGIKDARVAQLKSMLNNVPVPSGNTGNSLVTKIILGAVASIMIAAAGYWYFSVEDQSIAPDSLIQKQERKADEPVVVKPDATASQKQQPEPQEHQQPAVPQKQIVEADKNQTSAGTEHSKPSLAKKPDPLQAPGEKRATHNDVISDLGQVIEPSMSTLSIITAGQNAQYPFHYQLKNAQLSLFGPFEKDLYEIVEFSGNEKRTVFLYYKDRYYLLEEGHNNVRPLEPVTDAALLTKLRQSRSSR